MKKLLLSFLPLLLVVLTGFSAQARTVTVQWDVPGGIVLYQSPTSSVVSADTPVIDLSADATSYTISESDDNKQYYTFYPVEGYYIESATLSDGSAVALQTASWSDGTSTVKVGKWDSKYDGKTITIKLAKLEYYNVNIEVANGAEKLICQIQKADGKSSRNITLADGKQTLKLASYDKILYVRPNGNPVPALFACMVNNTTVEQQSYGHYNVPLTEDCNVYIAYRDPDKPIVKYNVTFEFVNNNPDCLLSIRDWTAGNFLDLAKINEGYQIEEGSELRINFKPDNTINSVKANGVEINYASNYKIESDTKFTIDVAGTSYAPLSATVYTNNIDAISFSNSTMHADAGAITVTAGEEKPAGSVTFSKVGYTIGVPTTEYTLGNISGKMKNVFFDLKPGYYLKEAVIANPGEDEDKYIAGAIAFAQANAPAFFNVGKIEFNTPARVYYEGPEGVARLRAKRITADGAAETVTYGGANPGETVANGWTDIKIDPAYNSYFEVSIYVDDAHENYEKYVLLDGVEMIPNNDDSDAPGVFSNIRIKENSELLIFFGEKKPQAHTLSFLTAGDAKATLSCDGTTVTDFSKDITSYSTSEYTLTPEAGTIVIVNGKEVSLEGGKYTFTPAAGSVTKIQLVKTGFSSFECTTDPVSGAVVKNLSSVDVLLTMPESFMTGESTANIVENPAQWISVSDGTTTYAVSSFEPGDPSETAIPFTLTLAKPITAAGTYTVNIPAGVIYESFPNADWSEFNRTAASRVNPEISLSLTVDPTIVYKWSFTPAAGSDNDLPAADDDPVVIILSLPEAKSLSEEAFTEAAGPWLTYNEVPVAKVDDAWEETGWSFTSTMDTYGKPALAIEISTAVFKTAGTLSILADEGAFTVNGVEASPALEYSANFGEVKTYSYEFTPAARTEISDWKEFTLTFPEAKTVEIDEANAYVMLSQGMTWGTMTVDMTVEGNTVTFKPQSEGEPKTGGLTLYIGEGTFIIDGVNPSAEISASWNYVRTAAVNFEWTASPSGKLVNEGWGLYGAIVYDEMETVSLYEPSQIVVKFNDEVLPALDWNNLDNMGKQILSEGNAIMVNVAGGILQDATTSGKLSVSIPAGALRISGKPNPEAIEHTWDVVAYKDYTLVTDPADGATVREINTVTVTFPEAEKVALHDNFVDGWISVYQGYSMIAKCTGVSLSADGVATVTFDPITTAGNYTIKIGLACFYLDDAQESDACSIKLTVDPNMSGIEGVDAANGLYTVYNLQGILVLRDATYDEYKALPAGIYIVNGKKTAKR